MKPYFTFIFFLLFFGSLSAQTSKPNIIYILADDLGYGDLGVYGQRQIETPNIDKLAHNGMLFTKHYSGSPVCAPSRSVLLTGKHTGHAYIRGNDEMASRGKVWSFPDMIADSTLEGQRPFPGNTTMLPKILKNEGYSTACIGKWGLGYPGSESTPNKMGFDFFYGYNCQRLAHTYYPTHLYRNEHREYLRNEMQLAHQAFDKNKDPYNPENYKQYSLSDYSPDLMFKELLGYVERSKAKPFFLYWATPVPHVSLQAPEKWVSYYVKKFGDEKPYDGSRGYLPTRYPHATYAAMISYLDEQVGQLVNYLKKEGLYDNTLIIFTSDNGPTFNGGTDSPWFDSSGPYKPERGRIKASVYEGGLRIPMIATWPNHIKAGSVSDHLSAFWDVMATLSDVTGAKAPTNDGISFLPTLLGKKQKKQHKYLYWEFPENTGSIAVRKGKWKAIIENVKEGNTELQLFDIISDPQELFDLSKANPKVVAEMRKIIQEAHVPSEVEKFRYPFDPEMK